jgi:hypothetical protein
MPGAQTRYAEESPGPPTLNPEVNYGNTAWKNI